MVLKSCKTDFIGPCCSKGRKRPACNYKLLTFWNQAEISDGVLKPLKFVLKKHFHS